MSKSANFQADSESLGKINTKKKSNFFFQYLDLPMDPQSLSTYHTTSA